MTSYRDRALLWNGKDVASGIVPVTCLGRQYSESDCRNSLVLGSRFFLDVGAWQGGKDGNPTTSFALVSGHDLVLCSWLKRAPGEQSGLAIQDFRELSERLPMLAAFEPTAALERFLSEAHSRSGGRGFIQQWGRSPVRKLTRENELFLIVGDLHLHLYRDGYLDRFRYRAETGDEDLQSLDAELRSLLDLAASVGSSYGVTTIQTGDMYEVWESEIMLRLLYLDAMRFRLRFPLTGAPHLEATGRCIDRIIETGRVPHRLDLVGRVERLDRSEVDVEGEGIDFRSTDEICAAIRREHADLFGGSTPSGRAGAPEPSPASASCSPSSGLFDIEIRGNHDNSLENRFWGSTLGIPSDLRSLDEHGFFTTSTRAASTVQPTHALSGVTSNIWLEHGHALDWHNNDQDWWLEEHGFHVVWKFLTDMTLDALQLRKGQVADEVAMQLADRWSDLCDYEMRLPEIRRADDLFFGTSEEVDFGQLSLVVMGHTHKPDVMLSYGSLSEAKADEYRNYFFSDKYWKPGGGGD